jgi:hypothetical protein
MMIERITFVEREEKSLTINTVYTFWLELSRTEPN